MTNRVQRLSLVQCQSFPTTLESGLFYYSDDFRSSAHLCACGREKKVVLPIKPAGWRLSLTAGTFTVSPSVGNREFACRSHYLIEKGRVVWLSPMSDGEAEASRLRDQRHIRETYAISVWQRFVNSVKWLFGKS
ncbi:DUF6527 family protein [Rhizobium leguminosarum]|uniref:DUF6527 family protein n=1 Tax=Rhizobium leguminosarum TaxID=384 RepID=UPI003CCA317B